MLNSPVPVSKVRKITQDNGPSERNVDLTTTSNLDSDSRRKEKFVEATQETDGHLRKNPTRKVALLHINLAESSDEEGLTGDSNNGSVEGGTSSKIAGKKEMTNGLPRESTAEAAPVQRRSRTGNLLCAVPACPKHSQGRKSNQMCSLHFHEWQQEQQQQGGATAAIPPNTNREMPTAQKPNGEPRECKSSMNMIKVPQRYLDVAGYTERSNGITPKRKKRGRPPKVRKLGSQSNQRKPTRTRVVSVGRQDVTGLAKVSPELVLEKEIFSKETDNALQVLFHLTRTHLAKGEIREAIMICHDVLKSLYSKAVTRLVEVLDEPSENHHTTMTNHIMLMREKTAGVWCLYAHLFIQIAESSVFQDHSSNVPQTGPNKGEGLKDQAMEILSLATLCPFVGNHSAITIALSRLRFKRCRHDCRQANGRSLPTDTLENWRDNLEASLYICQDGLEKSSSSRDCKRQITLARITGNERSFSEQIFKVSKELASLLVTFVEERDKGFYEGPPAEFVFFANIMGLPAKLEDALIGARVVQVQKEEDAEAKLATEQVEQQEPQKQTQTPPGKTTGKLPKETPALGINLEQAKQDPQQLTKEVPQKETRLIRDRPVPYLFFDPRSTKVLCLEMNCLSRLKESLKALKYSSAPRLALVPTQKSAIADRVAVTGGKAWDEIVFFQSMNAVLLEEGTKFMPSQLSFHLSSAAPFFRTEKPWSVGPSARNENSMYAKPPYYYKWHSLIYSCPKCAYLCDSNWKYVVHRGVCKEVGEIASEQKDTVWEAWEDLSFFKDEQDAAKQNLSRGTKASFSALPNVCYDIIHASECLILRTQSSMKLKNGVSKTPESKLDSGVSFLGDIFRQEAESNSDDQSSEHKAATESPSVRKRPRRDGRTKTVKGRTGPKRPPRKIRRYL